LTFYRSKILGVPFVIKIVLNKNQFFIGWKVPISEPSLSKIKTFCGGNGVRSETVGGNVESVGEATPKIGGSGVNGIPLASPFELAQVRKGCD